MRDNRTFKKIFELLIQPGKRLPSIYNWMMDEIWTEKNFSSNDVTHYFENGEKIITELEDIALASADSLYDELAAEAVQNELFINTAFKNNVAFVIFDGMSLREVPLLKKLAASTGFSVLESSYKFAALPSDTISFIEQRLIGKAIAPSQLESRKELKAKSIKYYYYDTPIRHFEISASENPLLLWSSFPDGTYSDFDARSSLHFETLVKQFDVVWKNIILSIPKNYKIIITSDHGYAYLGTGFDSKSDNVKSALNFLQQDRFRYYGDNENPPDDLKLQLIKNKNLAMLRGKIKNRPKGHSSNKVFRHGGMSLMEMITPWLVIERAIN